MSGPAKGFRRWTRRRAEILAYLPPVLEGRKMLRPFIMFGMVSTGAFTLRLTDITMLADKDWAMRTPLEEVVGVLISRCKETATEPKPLSERVLKAMEHRPFARREGDRLR